MPIKQINKEITSEHIQRFYEQMNAEERTNGGQLRPYASQVGSCSRMSGILGMMHKTSKDFPRSMNYYANIGNAVEESVVNEYILNGAILAYDFKIPTSFFDEFDVGGKIDIIYQLNDIPILADIKSTSQVSSLDKIVLTKEELNEILKDFLYTLPDEIYSKALYTACDVANWLLEKEREDIVDNVIDKIVTSKKTFNPVNHAYIAQVQTYSAITGIDHCYLQYYSRKVQDSFSLNGVPSLYVYEVDVSDKILKQRMANIYYALLCRDELVVPKKSGIIKKGHCQQLYCNFIDFCWNEADNPLDLPVISDERHDILWKEAKRKAIIYINDRPERAREFHKTLISEHDRIYSEIERAKQNDNYNEYVKREMNKRLNGG